jgi:Transposase, Mutator family
LQSGPLLQRTLRSLLHLSYGRRYLRLSQGLIRRFADIRKVIYTTNTVDALHRSLRKIIKTRGAFPNEESALKLLFLAIRQASRKWTMPVHNWSQALNYFTVLWPERMPGRAGRHDAPQIFSTWTQGKRKCPLPLQPIPKSNPKNKPGRLHRGIDKSRARLRASL